MNENKKNGINLCAASVAVSVCLAAMISSITGFERFAGLILWMFVIFGAVPFAGGLILCFSERLRKTGLKIDAALSGDRYSGEIETIINNARLIAKPEITWRVWESRD